MPARFPISTSLSLRHHSQRGQDPRLESQFRTHSREPHRSHQAMVGVASKSPVDVLLPVPNHQKSNDKKKPYRRRSYLHLGSYEILVNETELLQENAVSVQPLNWLGDTSCDWRTCFGLARLRSAARDRTVTDDDRLRPTQLGHTPIEDKRLARYQQRTLARNPQNRSRLS